MSDGSDYEIRVTRISVGPPNEPLYSERSMDIEIRDEAGGEFLALTQKSDHIGAQEFLIDREEWPVYREAIEQMMGNLRSYNNE